MMFDIDKLTESEKRALMLEIEELAQLEGLRNYLKSGFEFKISEDILNLLDNKADKTEVIKNDGTVSLTSDWDIGKGKAIKADKIIARSSSGLSLKEDSGNYGIAVNDDGSTTINTPLYLDNTNYRSSSASTATRTIYVSDSAGNDTTGDGSKSKPYKTIQKAISVLPDLVEHNITIAISQGTYTATSSDPISIRPSVNKGTVTIVARDLNDNSLYANTPIQANIYSSDTIGRSTLTLAENSLAGGKVWIVYGTGKGQIRNIVSNTSTTITVDSSWTTTPDSTSYFVYCGGVTINTAIPFNIQANNVYVYGLMIYGSASYYTIYCLGSAYAYIGSCYIRPDSSGYGVLLQRNLYSAFFYGYIDAISNIWACGIVGRYGMFSVRGTVICGNSGGNQQGITADSASFAELGSSSYQGVYIMNMPYGIVAYTTTHLNISNVSFYNVTYEYTYAQPNVRALAVQSESSQPYINIINKSATERDPQISFQVGATPSTKFVIGVDDSDGDKFKIAPSTLGTNDRFVIDASGNVGIGTSTQSAKLAINGGLHVGGDSDPGDDNLLVDGKIEIDGDLDHDGTKIGFFGVTPATRASAYTITNATTDRSYDADATTVDELADVLATLINDLKSYGLLQ